MGAEDEVEACGRCAMTSVVGLTDADRDPFEGPRIELDDGDLRSVSGHVVYLGRLKRRLNRWMAERTYGDLGR